MFETLSIYIYMDVVEWSSALDVRLSEWCYSVSMVWVQIKAKRMVLQCIMVWVQIPSRVYIRLKIKPNSVRIRF
jgi:hypothetical protein